MSAKAIHEATGKELLNRALKGVVENNSCVIVTSQTDWQNEIQAHPWLLTEKLVVKPDQLIKRRGKLGLIKAGVDLAEVKAWLGEHLGREISIGSSRGKLKRFIIEPFLPHKQDEEMYVCIHSHRHGDSVLFHHEGGVDIGDVDAKALTVEVAVNGELSTAAIDNNLLPNVKPNIKSFPHVDVTRDVCLVLPPVFCDIFRILSNFITVLYDRYRTLHFTYLEINPLVVTGDKVYILDLAAKLDQCAEFVCKQEWGDIVFPPPFGRDTLPEEEYIAELDAKSGASLKLTILNKLGRIWTMVAGGGASVIYADTICDLGGANELANYGEYSGAPSESQTYEYAKTLLSLMTQTMHPEGKVLIIGGGIANFTNVASTFKGIVRALRQFQQQLVEYGVSIYVRRAGPNYQEGLRVMRETGATLGVPVHVFGPETHMTAIVGMALGKRNIPKTPKAAATTANFLLQSTSNSPTLQRRSTRDSSELSSLTGFKFPAVTSSKQLFTNKTSAIVWGMQARAVQGMLDFDYVCRRETPSVVAMIYPFTGDHKQKFYWGHKEILIPMYKQMQDAMNNHPEADVLVSFASLRSAFESTMATMDYPQIRTIAIIAEGIPENQTREIIKMANSKGVTVIGPATVGAVKPGCFKIGNTGGMLDNILASRLYRPGSVAYVSRSGGMSNELNNIISLNTNGVYAGVAIGGDRYPGTTFWDHVERYQNTAEVKMIVLLGEVGGVEEYKIAEGVKSGVITKPIISWCIGTCAKMFTSEVQFGHAGSCANADIETAEAKNKALAEAGVSVPESFDQFGEVIRSVYVSLVEQGTIVEVPEVAPPTVPMDFAWARELGLIRKPASFMTRICDERGQELLYAGIPITDIFKEDMGIGGVLSLLWFQRRLPRYATKFLEMILMVTADHGPAVSGAHNTIVCTRAGKDLVSCLTSGLLTIGDRFGGALDAAARQFSDAYNKGIIPMEFVNDMRKKGELIMGIGHRVKSINNPDMRVVILKDFVKKNLPATPLLDYAIEVEKITTSKKPNLILNVDGFIGVAMVDLLRNCGCFTNEEALEFIEIGALNGLFVLGRSMGFIGHYLDQRRLRQGLYRHPWDDISYILPDQ